MRSINSKSVLVSDVIVHGAIDLLVLVETWHICSNDIPLRRAAPAGYSIIDAPRPGFDISCSINHGGIAVIYRDAYVVRAIDTHLLPTSFELLACHLVAASSKLALVTVYRPSSHPVTEIFFEEFTSLLELLSTYSSNVVIMGDFNLHVDDVTDAAALRFLDLLDAFGFVQHIKGATHSCGHTLDLVITQPTCCPTHINVDPPVISDHGLVSCSLILARPSPVALRRKSIRRLHAIDDAAFITAVQQSSICSNIATLALCSTGELCALYMTELRRILDNMAPLVNVPVTDGAAPWLDGECRACRRRTRALERCYRRSRLAVDRQAWAAALNEKRTLFADKEQTYWTRKLQVCSSNSKQLWRCLNTILLRGIAPVNSTVVTAQSLSSFFIDKVIKVRQATHTCPPAVFTGPCLSQLNDFVLCTIDDIRRVIMQSPGKSCDLDPLPFSLFMTSLNDILPFLHLVCNSSLSSGVLPECEKAAVITPILKKPGLDIDSTSSYRPVSNLTFLSKLVERLASRQLTAYLQQHHLLMLQQSAYREHHSTETATLKVASDVFDAMDAGKVTMLALLDLSAAFDTVDHDILLRRLHYTYGIGGTVLRWIRSFLTDRTQVVNFSGHVSTGSVLTCGVPQGSVLGPLLFTLYTADVVSIVQAHDISVHCYADDLQLYTHCRPRDTAAAAARLLHCIQAVDEWMGSNRLKMNPDKTQIIWLGSRQRLATFDTLSPLRLHDGTIVTPSTSVRNLGVVFDSEMLMADHVNSITRACFYQLRQLRFVRRSLTRESAELLVHAFISSRVDYCNSLLYGASSHVTRKLQAILNASARLITGIRRFDHITPALRDELHWLPVKQRVHYKIALMVYKCLHGACPSYLRDCCTALASNDQHNLRSSARGDICRHRTATRRLGTRSFKSSAPSVWNSLPPAVRHCHTLTSFKHELKTHLFTAAYLT